MKGLTLNVHKRARWGAMRCLTLGIGLLTAALVLSSCGDSDSEGSGSPQTSSGGSQIDSSKPEVQLALISISLPGSDYIKQFGDGAGAAVKYINEELGGFGGREVAMSTCDTKLTPAGSTACANDALDDEPVAMIGCDPLWSSSGLPVFQAAGVMSFNCPTAPEEYNSDANFSVSTGGVAEYTGMGLLACDQGAKTVAVFATDTPYSRTATPLALAKGLDTCGAKAEFTYVPPTTTDMTPQLTKVLQSDPDWIIPSVGQTQTVQVYQALSQAGFPADHTSMWGSVVVPDVVRQGGATMDGLFTTWQFQNPYDTDNADVAAYQSAMKAAGNDEFALEATQWGFVQVMTIYNVAKEAGFDSFSAASLTSYLQSDKPVSVFASREAGPPGSGPENYTQMRQPFVQLMQLKSGKLETLADIGEDGWVNVFE